MKWNRVPAWLGAGCLALTMSVAAQTGSGTDTTGAPSGAMKAGNKSGTSDKTFVKKAIEGSNAEIQLGQLAAQKGSASDVKQFGQKMVDDHTKLNEQMKQVASQVGVTPTDDVAPADKALQTKLNALSGDAFDKAYIRAMVKDHRKDLVEFKHEAGSAKNPALKDAAQQGSTVIEQHLQMAEQMAQSHGVTSKKAEAKSGGQ